MREILSAIPTFSKYQLFLLAMMVGNLIFQTVVVSRYYKRSRNFLKESIHTLECANEIRARILEAETFYNTTFCACESCKNRECPRKLTRFVIADAVRMGVPIRVDNFMGDCSGYTEEEEL